MFFFTAAGIFVIRHIKKFFISWHANNFFKPWLHLKWNSISKGSCYRGYNLTWCSNLFLPLIPHQQKLLHPRATWHSQSHGNNQPEAKNARYQEGLHLDVCLLSKDHRTTECSLPFQSICHPLKPWKQQQGRRGSGRPKMPFLQMQLSSKPARNLGKLRRSITL